MTGPAWDNSFEYPSISSEPFAADRRELDKKIQSLKDRILLMKPLMDRVLGEPATLEPESRATLLEQLQSIAEMFDEIRVLIGNLQTYVSMVICIDGSDAEAQRMSSELMQVQSEFEATGKPVWIFLDRADESFISEYLDHPYTESETFALRQSRLFSDTILSEPEETLLTRMRVPGLAAWGELYDKIASSMRLRISKSDKSEEIIGLAQALGQLRDSSEPKRKAAWNAIQEGWREHENACAYILNSIASWRLEEMRRRSYKRKMDFLDMPLHLARIRQETLDAMMQAVMDDIEIPRRAMRALAKGLGKPQADPWDLLASAPTTQAKRSWEDAMDLIREALSGIDPKIGDFVDMMRKNKWIEGRVLPNKRQGAFCSRFPKSRTPRVFQTFLGSVSDVRTLAHELGHGYHAWVMRDLPMILHRYPMTLAETASIFAETAVADHISASGDETTKFQIAWQNAESATGYLLNIPARFEFERDFYQLRKKSFVSPNELGDMMERAWKNWYGDTLSAMDRRFWQTKLHFSIPWISFYNYPYTFGYLFSLRIYALRQERGSSFMNDYNNLLKDTGRLTAEDLVKEHLGENIRRPEFWKASLKIVAQQIETFEQMVAKMKR